MTDIIAFLNEHGAGIAAYIFIGAFIAGLTATNGTNWKDVFIIILSWPIVVVVILGMVIKGIIS